MKRKKRDRLQRAYSKGYFAGIQGRSSGFCPHQEIDHREYWLSGWRAGRFDLKEGKFS